MPQPKKKNTKVTIKPKFTLFAQANEANNRLMDLPTSYPATAKDSADYIHGFNLGIKGVKLTDKSAQKYDSNEFSRKGVWEGKNSQHSFRNRDAKVIAKKLNK
jgi:hypothetical protein